ncbi:asialoglycoprotein receptor 2-like [Synchiropus splendidus]|uniref:asialoglycoprotein receptor 2-like n=1 Tax=Synchiropus splendidus TaxID=270530 RepID=UPI00237E880E|nr:asialoglycoprotein receptor 2-like [Synchiropus splendidus]XP_053744011.1 asialoglycoprotein receptor 2-like [Synchiropus splendidus]
MSVAFNSESSEMKYSNLDLIETDSWFRSQRRSTTAERWMRPSAVCSVLLVLLLLIGILTLVAQNTGRSSTQPASESLKSQWENLTIQWLQLQEKCHALEKEKEAIKAERDVISVDRDCLRAERDALKPERDTLKNETKVCAADKQRLGTENKVLLAERDGLRAERNQMREANKNLTEEIEGLKRRYDNLVRHMDHTLNGTDKACPVEWLQFESSCYYISAAQEPKRWLTSKKECENLNGHLVIIDSKQENDFVSKFFQHIWIGLSDRDKEGKWKWVDGTALTGTNYWASGEPNNADSNEDCAELLRDSKEWNDVPCGQTLSFICEM